jgi:hypothetical protein
MLKKTIAQRAIFAKSIDQLSDGSSKVKRYQQQYGKAPAKLSADRRYFSAANESKAYEAGIKHVSICKPGYWNEQRRQIEKEGWFKKLQKFRAGIDGVISGLIRGLGDSSDIYGRVGRPSNAVSV